jgi:hypothetical protein
MPWLLLLPENLPMAMYQKRRIMIKRVHGTEDVIFIDEDNGEQQADFLE